MNFRVVSGAIIGHKTPWQSGPFRLNANASLTFTSTAVSFVGSGNQMELFVDGSLDAVVWVTQAAGVVKHDRSGIVATTIVPALAGLAWSPLLRVRYAFSDTSISASAVAYLSIHTPPP